MRNPPLVFRIVGVITWCVIAWLKCAYPLWM